MAVESAFSGPILVPQDGFALGIRPRYGCRGRGIRGSSSISGAELLVSDAPPRMVSHEPLVLRFS